MSEPMGKELARLVYEELIIEFPGYKSLPEPMAKALIILGVNNGIRFSTSSTDKLQEQLNTAKKALTEIADVKRRLEQTTDFGVGFQTTNNALAFAVVESEKALAAIGGDDEK
jgi:hypothetical protein